LLPSLLSATPYTILAEKELSLLAREFLPRICLLELRCTPPLMLSSSLEDGQDFYRQSTRCRNRPWNRTVDSWLEKPVWTFEVLAGS